MRGEGGSGVDAHAGPEEEEEEEVVEYEVEGGKARPWSIAMLVVLVTIKS